MMTSRSARAFLQDAASGALARRAASARSMALSMACHSAAERGFSEGSASSQDVSRSLILIFAAARSPLATKAAESTTMTRKGDRSPIFEAVRAAAGDRNRTEVPRDELPATKIKNTVETNLSFVIECLLRRE